MDAEGPKAKSGARVVRGRVVLPPSAPAATGDVVVQVEDVSRADAPSRVVGEMRKRHVQLGPHAEVPFEVEIPPDALDPGGDYSVRVHVDMSGSGQVDKGDLITMQSYPVLTHGYGDDARVEVRQV
jgi:uncharacterized lipoprotein YbaY